MAPTCAESSEQGTIDIEIAKMRMHHVSFGWPRFKQRGRAGNVLIAGEKDERPQEGREPVHLDISLLLSLSLIADY